MDFRKRLVEIFNNAFDDGEEGEELRNDHLAEDYALTVLKEIASQIPKIERNAWGECSICGDIVPDCICEQSLWEVAEALHLDGVTRTDAKHQLEGKKE